MAAPAHFPTRASGLFTVDCRTRGTAKGEKRKGGVQSRKGLGVPRASHVNTQPFWLCESTRKPWIQKAKAPSWALASEALGTLWAWTKGLGVGGGTANLLGAPAPLGFAPLKWQVWWFLFYQICPAPYAASRAGPSFIASFKKLGSMCALLSSVLTSRFPITKPPCKS